MSGGQRRRTQASHFHCLSKTADVGYVKPSVLLSGACELVSTEPVALED